MIKIFNKLHQIKAAQTDASDLTNKKPKQSSPNGSRYKTPTKHVNLSIDRILESNGWITSLWTNLFAQHLKLSWDTSLHCGLNDASLSAFAQSNICPLNLHKAIAQIKSKF